MHLGTYLPNSIQLTCIFIAKMHTQNEKVPLQGMFQKELTNESHQTFPKLMLRLQVATYLPTAGLKETEWENSWFMH